MPATATAFPTPGPQGSPDAISVAGPRSDDELLAFLLISTWMVRTGRRLRSVPDHAELTREELIEFWADETDLPGQDESPSGQR